MALTWRDLVSTVAGIAIVYAYASYMDGSTLWLLASTWATTAVILLLGIIGAWAIWAAGDLRASPKTSTAGGALIARLLRYLVVTEICRAAEVIIGVICLVAGLSALLSDSVFALRLAVVTAVGLFGLAILRHALTVPSAPSAE